MNVSTIGFTKKSAEDFFERLRESGATCLVDMRLNNVSQLAGFTKKDDLAYFLRKVCRMKYVHLPELAPTQKMLDAYHKEHHDWETYERQFLDLMDERSVEKKSIKRTLSNGCLLCSEDKPDHCHRRLVAEYLQTKWEDLEIIHL